MMINQVFVALSVCLISGSAGRMLRQRRSVPIEADSSSLPPQLVASAVEARVDPALPMPGNAAVLRCEAFGNPAPAIHWLRNGKRLDMDQNRWIPDHLDAQPGSLGVQITESKLDLDCVDASVTGTYTCVADNGREAVSSNVTLNMNAEIDLDSLGVCSAVNKRQNFILPIGMDVSPARINMWADTRLEVVTSSAQLYCRASGWPLPTIRWFLANETMDGLTRLGEIKNGEGSLGKDQYEILPNGDLFIIEHFIRKGESSMTVYECEAENSIGSESRVSAIIWLSPEADNIQETAESIRYFR